MYVIIYSSNPPIILEQAIGATGTFRERCRLYLEYVDKVGNGIYERKLSYNQRGSILASEADLVQKSLQNNDILRLRVRMNSSNDQSLYIYTSTKLCLLAAVEYKHDVYFTIDSANDIVRNIDIRLPVGTPSVCSGYHPSVPSAGFDLTTRYGIVQVEDSQALAGVLQVKGIPYPNQKELSSVDVLTAANGAGLPVDPTIVQQADAEKEKAATEQKSLWSGYWPYMIGGYILLQMFTRGGGGPEGNRPAAAAARGSGGGPAR